MRAFRFDTIGWTVPWMASLVGSGLPQGATPGVGDDVGTGLEAGDGPALNDVAGDKLPCCPIVAVVKRASSAAEIGVPKKPTPQPPRRKRKWSLSCLSSRNRCSPELSKRRHTAPA